MLKIFRSSKDVNRIPGGFSWKCWYNICMKHFGKSTYAHHLMIVYGVFLFRYQLPYLGIPIVTLINIKLSTAQKIIRNYVLGSEYKDIHLKQPPPNWEDFKIQNEFYAFTHFIPIIFVLQLLCERLKTPKDYVEDCQFKKN